MTILILFLKFSFTHLNFTFLTHTIQVLQRNGTRSGSVLAGDSPENQNRSRMSLNNVSRKFSIAVMKLFRLKLSVAQCDSLTATQANLLKFFNEF